MRERDESVRPAHRVINRAGGIFKIQLCMVRVIGRGCCSEAREQLTLLAFLACIHKKK